MVVIAYHLTNKTCNNAIHSITFQRPKRILHHFKLLIFWHQTRDKTSLIFYLSWIILVTYVSNQWCQLDLSDLSFELIQTFFLETHEKVYRSEIRYFVGCIFALKQLASNISLWLTPVVFSQGWFSYWTEQNITLFQTQVTHDMTYADVRFIQEIYLIFKYRE